MSLFSIEDKEKNGTVALIIVNIVAFFMLVMATRGWGIYYLAQVNALIFQGEVWRLFSSLFIHGDWLHLFSNMFALFLFGVQLEDEVGVKRMLLIYFTSGIFANIMGLIFTPPEVFSLGASGCIFGLLGAFFIGIRRFDPAALIVGIVFVLFFVILSIGPGIDAWAHFFGAVAGSVFGYVYSREPEEKYANVY